MVIAGRVPCYSTGDQITSLLSHRVTLSPVHLVTTVSPCPRVTVSPCHRVTVSPKEAYCMNIPSRSPLVVPPAFAEATITREGEAGRVWIAELPQLVEALCEQWQLVVEGPP